MKRRRRWGGERKVRCGGERKRDARYERITGESEGGGLRGWRVERIGVLGGYSHEHT